jgi:dTMP kinase
VSSEICRRSAGRFIVLEGIDGSGTTTQGRALVAAFEHAGLRAHFTHEPSGLPIGLFLRQLLSSGPELERPDWDAMALLFAADRLQHVAREIEPLLARGVTVVSDRYDLSSLAYQSATAPGGANVVPWLRAVNRRARRPDVTLVFDVDPSLAEARRAGRGGSPELFERRELQARLAEIYRRAEELVPGDALVHLDANGTLEAVTANVMAALGRAFPA